MPVLCRGHRINVKKNRYGDLLVHFRRLQMDAQLNPKEVAKEIKQELQSAKRALGV